MTRGKQILIKKILCHFVSVYLQGHVFHCNLSEYVLTLSSLLQESRFTFQKKKNISEDHIKQIEILIIMKLNVDACYKHL